MSKSGLRIVTLLFFLATSITFAQSFSNAKAPAQSITPETAAKKPTVMSPDDFKNRVKDLNKKTQSELNQQLNSNLAKQPSNLPSAMPGNNNPPKSFDAPQNTPHRVPPNNSNNQSDDSLLPGMDQSGGYTGSLPAGQDSDSAIPPSDSENKNPAPKSSGGWNIQY